MNLVDEIKNLKKEKNALILAHYYQRDEVQDIADYVGDSYYLSKIAMNSPEQAIIFCGVKFMAESAKILSPNKKVYLPNSDAGCPMADMADAQSLAKLKEKHPNALVVSYINSNTDVKALCDVCVTSSSALSIMKNIPNEEIIFLPDKNLGEYIAEQFPNKKFYLWDGYCITHKKVKKETVQALKDLRPLAEVLVHPECEKEIRDMANFLGSTGEIIDYSVSSHKDEFIVLTESGVLHEMKKRSPHKKFYVPGTTMTCINMKKTTLEDIYITLKEETNEIILDEDVRMKAYKALENMHLLS
ncbi:quinolinate synthase NadA [Clostridium intestinale]|uniref:Quinolinate synthase n=1 Tax=Clostridium intestinale DSM 6191 TaxID=1121320 RepID=A0A1M5Y1W1_9CLOT|nr:quinolinate synthase NadA [Clostridium intestinale]SHI05992.1 quinolinate synthetase [Clostridium intestinale DSM 6191]